MLVLQVKDSIIWNKVCKSIVDELFKISMCDKEDPTRYCKGDQGKKAIC